MEPTPPFSHRTPSPPPQFSPNTLAECDNYLDLEDDDEGTVAVVDQPADVDDDEGTVAVVDQPADVDGTTGPSLPVAPADGSNPPNAGFLEKLFEAHDEALGLLGDEADVVEAWNEEDEADVVEDGEPVFHKSVNQTDSNRFLFPLKDGGSVFSPEPNETKEFTLFDKALPGRSWEITTRIYRGSIYIKKGWPAIRDGLNIGLGDVIEIYRSNGQFRIGVIRAQAQEQAQEQAQGD